MILVKYDIQKIDNFLKKEVTNWDIRIEMIDHLASKLESQENIEITNDFLRKEFGPYWKIRQTAKLKMNAIHFKYRKLFFQNFVKYIQSFSGLLILFFLFIVEFYVVLNYTINQFYKMNILFTSLYILVFVLLYVKQYRWKNNALVINYLMHYTVFPYFVVSNLFYNLFVKRLKIYPKIGVPIIGIFSCLMVVWLLSNYKMIKSELATYANYFDNYKNVTK